MARKPKPFFWIVVLLVCASLTGLALYRMGLIGGGDKTATAPDTATTPGRTRGEILELAFYSSSAKSKWIDEMTARFNNSGRTADGKTIRVKAVHVTSGGSLDQIKEGKIKPDMWSPGDESWLRLADNHWRNVRQKTLFDKHDDLVNIPLVIAMWEPMAQALGHPSPIGWHDIANLAASDQGWAAYGHPEWGRFRWGHAHPDANSGFLTVISEVYAATGKTDGIAPEDLKKAEVMSFLQKIEGAVEQLRVVQQLDRRPDAGQGSPVPVGRRAIREHHHPVQPGSPKQAVQACGHISQGRKFLDQAPCRDLEGGLDDPGKGGRLPGIHRVSFKRGGPGPGHGNGAQADSNRYRHGRTLHPRKRRAGEGRLGPGFSRARGIPCCEESATCGRR